MKETPWHLIIIVLIIGSTFLLMKGSSPSVVSGFPSAQRDTISVSGSSDLDVAPDQAEITIAIETEGATAKEAQDANSAISNKVISAIKQQGVKKDEIETTSYYLYKREGYNPQTGKPVTLGYQQSHTLKITVKDLDTAGDVIDAVTNAGANRIQHVAFSLSKEKRIEANTKALRLAAEHAREKATALADSLGVGLGDAITISETNYIFQPRPFDYAMAAAPALEEKTQILPGDVTLSLTVNVVFEIT